jgi:methionyl-tRNA formyltransferase
VAFAGDRQLSLDVLAYLVDQGVRPVALLVPAERRATHASLLISICAHLKDDCVLHGTEFREDSGIGLLRSLDIDFVISVHFPYVVPENALSVAKHGWVNLHPALLPYNRGWHTPTWTILDGTPAGATLHFMDAGLDTGDVIHQRAVEVGHEDTADTLYQKLLAAELDVFREAWPSLSDGTYSRCPQDPQACTTHTRQDLRSSRVQYLDLSAVRPVGDVLRQLRALTTSRLDEAAFFEDSGGRRYRVQVRIVPETAETELP